MIFSSLPVMAESNSCVSHLTGATKVDTNFSKVQQKIHMIDVSLEQEILARGELSLEDLYLHIKNKAWELLPNGMLNWKDGPRISELMKRRWISNFSHRYRIEKLKDEELVIFYANHLQSIYMQLLPMIKDSKIDELNLGDVDAKVKKQLINVLTKFWGVDLRNSGLDPVLAQEILYDQSYKNLNWVDITKAFSVLVQEEVSQENFEKVVSSLSLTSTELALIKTVYLAMNYKAPSDTCCKTKPGCLFCPNNLGFLNQDDTPPIPKLRF